MSDVYNRTPVNKTAALITNQSDCEDDFFLNQIEKLKSLGQQKAHYSKLAHSLKQEIGVRGRWRQRDDVPAYIYKNSKYPILLGVIDELKKIEESIIEIKKDKKRYFDHGKFIYLLREKYPDIFDEINKEANQCPIKTKQR